MKNLSFGLFVLVGLSLLTNCANQQMQVAAQEKQTIQVSNQPKNSQTTDVEKSAAGKIVLEYINLARNNELSNLKKLVTRTPQSYWDYQKRKTLEMFPEMRTDSSKGEYPSMKPLDDFAYEEVSKELPKLLYQGRDIDKIESIFEKGNEARVRVLFKTRSGVPAVGDSIDFYLFRDNKKNWRIFYWKFSITDSNETYPM